MKKQRDVTIPVLLLTIGIVLYGIAVSGQARGKANPQTEGALWLSWNTKAREAFVTGYLRGFQRGKQVACAFYGENVMPKSPGPSIHIKGLPERTCMKSLPDLTEPYFKAYVDKINEYYKKYPDDREAGLSTLMENLATPPGLTVDQIHSKLTESPR